MQQVSPESPTIFDFILELHRSCAGDWNALVYELDISRETLDRFLIYAATFLSNVGNYYVCAKMSDTFLDFRFYPRGIGRGILYICSCIVCV